MPDRTPMSPAEFDAATRRFVDHFAGLLHQTSGTRSVRGNLDAGGNEQSKHLYGMARDYRLITPADVNAVGPKYPPEKLADSATLQNRVVRYASRLGFWTQPYDWGLHVQGLPPGPIPHWWWLKYGKGQAAEAVGAAHLPELVRAGAR